MRISVMWERLADYVTVRRAELRLTREELADRARVSSRVLSDIEHHRRENFDADTLLRLEHALEWAPGSISRIMAGGSPSPAESNLPPPLPVEMAYLAEVYSKMDDGERAELLLRVGWVADWGDMVLAQRLGRAPRRRIG